MLILVTTDTSTHQSAARVQRMEDELGVALERYSGELTQLEVHLSDQTGRAGPADLRCVLEAVPAGRPPLVVTEHATTVDDAVRAAAHTLSRLLAGDDGRLRHVKGGDTVRHGGSLDG